MNKVPVPVFVLASSHLKWVVHGWCGRFCLFMICVLSDASCALVRWSVSSRGYRDNSLCTDEVYDSKLNIIQFSLVAVGLV